MVIGIVNYEAGNIFSVSNALRFLGEESVIINNPDDFEGIDRLVLPGVGSFGRAMEVLTQKKLVKPIVENINNGLPILGICLGMQILMNSSEEAPNVKGLGLVEGTCYRYQNKKTPQIGWNKVKPVNKSQIKSGYAYFVNSYYPLIENKSIITTTSEYGIEFTSSYSQENIIGTQFHPEKSGDWGLEFLKRWFEC